MNILFICKWNRFRSKVAEAYFNKIRKNKNLKAKSNGFLEDNVPLKSSEIKRNKWIKEKYGISLDKTSRGINVKDLNEANKIIVIANEIPLSILKDKKIWNDKLSVWKIKDVSTFDKDKINKTIDTIKIKVEALVKQLEKKNDN